MALVLECEAVLFFFLFFFERLEFMNIYLSLHSTTGIVHSSSLSENALSLVRCCPVCVNTWWELTGALESLTGRCSRDVARLFFF